MLLLTGLFLYGSIVSVKRGYVMLRIAICDDNKEHRKEIRNAVSSILFDLDDLELESFSDGSDVITLINNGLFFFDLILLDIMMPVTDGLLVAKAIRENHLATDIIFVTGYEEYVYEGYVYKAFAYLKKPVSASRLAKELNRYLLERENSGANFLILSFNGCRQKLNIQHIDYIESFKRKVSIVMGNSSFEFYTKLDEIEQHCASRMVRTHQSYLVNLQKISRLSKTEAVLDSGASIPVSKRYYDSTCRAFERVANALCGAQGVRSQ